MKKLILIFIMVIFFIAGLISGPVKDSNDILVKLNFYEGLKGEQPEGEKIVSTYFLKSLFVGKINVDNSGKSESAEIKKIFNLSGLNLMSEAKWGWRRGEKQKEFQVLILNGHEFIVEVTMKEMPDNFIVMVMNRENKKILLKSDLILPEKKSSVFGFEDAWGKPFFLSLSRAAGESILRKETPAKKIARVKNPVLIKKVNPIYPKEALKRKISGIVKMEAICDIYGKVEKINVISGNPILGKAASDALKQWVYEPFLINNKPQPVQFTVIVKFHLDPKKKKLKEAEPVNNLILINGTPPAYPETAKRARVSGTVRIETTINEKGDVTNVKVLNGHPLLTPAARAAVVNWKFKPVTMEGKPVKTDAHIQINFTPDLNVKIHNSIVKKETGIPDIWPARGYLTLTFGEKRPVNEKGNITTKKGKFIEHKGVDIAAKRGSNVVAPAGGKVIEAKFYKYYGKMVTIDHGNGYTSKYAHLDELKVKKGQRVKKGSLIGLVGNTGVSTGPHLHWEVHYKGKAIDPLKLIKE